MIKQMYYIDLQDLRLEPDVLDIFVATHECNNGSYIPIDLAEEYDAEWPTEKASIPVQKRLRRLADAQGIPRSTTIYVEVSW